MKLAKRITNLPPYPFAALDRTVARLRSEGVDVIRLDIGSPDLPPSDELIGVLQGSAARPDRHGYGGYFGTKQFRQAVATYYRNRFGVEVDPDKEVLSLLGSKEGIANIATAWLDPGDVALVPDPGYPTYSIAPRMVGAGSYPMPLLEKDNFLPDFGAIPRDVVGRARLMWLNYPNNPTGAIAPDDFLRQAIDFCRRHDILLCFDAPYCDNTYDGYVAPSILQYEGAIDVSLEFNSLSKSHNLAGWRVAMAVGNREALQALALVKSNVDSGSPLPVQEMAAAALTGDQSWLLRRNEVYRERRDMALEGVAAMGLRAIKPKGAIYVWIAVPSGWESMPYTEALLADTGVSLAAGSVYGEHGEGYVRISLVQDVARMREAMGRWQDWWRKQG